MSCLNLHKILLTLMSSMREVYDEALKNSTTSTLGTLRQKLIEQKEPDAR